MVVAQLQGQQEESQARGGSWGKPSAHPENPWQGSSSGARQAVGAGQGTVPGMGSAISNPLQSSGTAPRVPKDTDHPRPSQEEPPWGEALGTHPVGAGWQNTTSSLAGTVAQALPAPRTQSPSAPGSHSLWQPQWAVVRLLIHPVQHRHTNTAVHLTVPMKKRHCGAHRKPPVPRTEQERVRRAGCTHPFSAHTACPRLFGAVGRMPGTLLV